MADNTVLNSGAGGDTISTDDLGAVKVQRVKVQYGVDGSATDVAADTGLPVINRGQDSNSAWQTLRVTRALGIITHDYAYEAALGNISTAQVFQQSGYNPNASTGAAADIVSHDVTPYAGQPTAATAETVEVFSSSANDTSAGTGARTVRITGLESFATTTLTQETLTMNGVTAVTSSNTYVRILKVEVLTAGSGGSNAGTITCRHTTTTANIFDVMQIGDNESLNAVCTIPGSKVGVLKVINVATTFAANNGVLVLSLWRKDGNTADSAYRRDKVLGLGPGIGSQVVFDPPLTFSASEDFKFTQDEISAGAGDVGINFGIIFEDV